MYLLVAAPNGKTPAACFVGPNFGGNHLLTDHDKVRIPTGVDAGSLSRRGEEPGDRGGSRQAGRYVAAAADRRDAATPSRRSTAATSSPTGRTCAKECGRRSRSRPANRRRRDRDDHVVGVGLPPRGRLPRDRQEHRREAARGGRPLAARQDGAAGRRVRRPHRGRDPAPGRLRRHRAEPARRTRRPRP